MNNIFLYNNNFDKYQHIKSIMLYGDVSLCPNPQISVIMPVYGDPPFFLNSYLSVLNQDIKLPYEIVIVDNTPLDGNKSNIQIFLEDNAPANVFYYRNEENIGMIGNWNRGITLCRASVFTYCHDDDMLFPDCLSTLLQMKVRYSGKFIIPSCRIIDERIGYPLNDDRIRKESSKCSDFGKIDIFMGNPTNGVGCLFYKEHMVALGGYDEEFYPSHDNALHIKYICTYGAIKYDRQLYCYRITNGNESNNVYRKFITNGVFYSQCMYPYLKLPRFILKAMTHAYEANITETMERAWGKDKNYRYERTLFDEIVNFAFFVRGKLKQWR